MYRTFIHTSYTHILGHDPAFQGRNPYLDEAYHNLTFVQRPQIRNLQIASKMV